MAEQSEKRFHSIMDKLFHTPKPKIPTRDKKRGKLVSIASVVESNPGGNAVGGFKHSLVPSGSSQTPLCRPWDRGDLTRRLATFKSMTWFGKPKVVSAVNCARRGWINVEMDIIACEACGSRLLFSTPSSWTQQQVEKAAAVFSLKLDNGHKLLCPWIDNACDETLAQFPPTTAPALVDAYKERSAALLQLSALPVISSSAIDYMRSSQLDHFLEQSILGYSIGSADTWRNQYIGNEFEALSATLYYQAHKLISLCGWEPRSLPYVVDCKDRVTQSTKDAHPSDSSQQIANGESHGIIIYSLSGADELTEEDEDHQNLGHQSDPDSFVVDCRLCGASVGLWAFSTVPRPLELFRLVGSTEVNGQTYSASSGANATSSVTGAPGNLDDKENHTDNNGVIRDTRCNSGTSLKENILNLNLTIAGGPPPTKQNFRATVSLPIISRHLRTGFSSYFDVGDRSLSSESGMNHENIQFDSQNNNLFQQEKGHTDNTLTRLVQPENVQTSKCQKNDDGHCISGSNDQSSCLNQDFVEVVENQNNDQMASDGRCSSGQTFPSVHAVEACCDSRMENPIGSMQNLPLDSGQMDTSLEEAENAAAVDSEMGTGSSSQVRESFITTPDSNDKSENGEISKNKSLLMVVADDCNHQQDQKNVDDACKVEPRKADQGSDFQNSSLQIEKQKADGVNVGMQSSVNGQITAHKLGNDLKRARLDQVMEFDPIRQHRHFCPWITSTGSTAPGWIQTLSALNRTKESLHPSVTDSPSSSKLEVDDPISSVRKLFTSPSSAKKMKRTHSSS